MSPRSGVVSVLAVLAVSLSISAVAQEFRATVTGRVTDPVGTGIPGAKVTVQNAGTNEQLSTTTSADGDYTVPFLVPGKYSVNIEAAKFKQESRKGYRAPG